MSRSLHGNEVDKFLDENREEIESFWDEAQEGGMLRTATLSHLKRLAAVSPFEAEALLNDWIRRRSQ